ncbi:MAG: LLM class flavin-dependent oxidoreductase [Chloroflexi bacterium]|nr:LLM class flavin-dependent oxidoreductase [Chloroflexota bacterium]
MRYGFVLPGGDPLACAGLAAEAEAAGWDGVFVPDAISIETEAVPPAPFHDPWVTLAAMATRTTSARLGTMITPLPRRRPWKLARETVSLDHLSGGRVILAAGLGAAADDAGFYKVGEAMDIRIRAAMLDEGLEVLAGLWTGRPVSFHGRYYDVQGMTLLPPPVQTPRIPIWVVGVLQSSRSLARALRWDGVVLQKGTAAGGGAIVPSEVAEVKQMAMERRAQDAPFAIVLEGETPGGNAREATAIVRPFAEAGITWWLESRWTAPGGLSDVRRRIAQGPPRA